MADHVVLQDFLRRHRLQHNEVGKVTGYSLDLVRSVLYQKRAMPEPMLAVIQAIDALAAVGQDRAAVFILQRLRERPRNVTGV